MAVGRHFKKDKRPYLGNNLADWREICTVSHIDPPNRTDS